jgi:hypothetical protein
LFTLGHILAEVTLRHPEVITLRWREKRRYLR